MNQPHPHPQQPGRGRRRGVDDETTRIPQYKPKTPVAPDAGTKRRWPWIVGGIMGVFVLIGACNSGSAQQGFEDGMNSGATPAADTAPPPDTQAPAVVAPAEPVVTQVVLPEVAGRNGGIVYDELVELGLTNFDLATRDVDDTVVLLPQNWTAVSIEPGAGTEVDSDDTVIVTMTKEN